MQRYHTPEMTHAERIQFDAEMNDFIDRLDRLDPRAEEEDTARFEAMADEHEEIEFGRGAMEARRYFPISVQMQQFWSTQCILRYEQANEKQSGIWTGREFRPWQGDAEVRRSKEEAKQESLQEKERLVK